MKLGKTEEMLIEELTLLYPEIVQDDKIISEICSQLENHGMNYGYVSKILSDPKELYNADLNELFLLGEQFYIKLHRDIAWINEWLSESEIKKLRQYFRNDDFELDKIELPLTIPAFRVSEKVYVAVFENTLIARLYKYGISKWNEDIQRQSKKVKSNGKLISAIDVNQKNVNAISKQAKEDRLLETMISYNCAVGTSTVGQELSYDEKNMTLTIHEGTSMDILDGMHRNLGILAAYTENHDLEGSMIVRLSNYSTKEAQRFQVDISKATPLKKSRIQALDHTRITDEIIDQLKLISDLKGDRITSRTETPNKSHGELVSYLTFSNALKDFVSVKNKLEAIKVAEELSQYFMYLFGEFEQYVEDNDNLLFRNQFFRGHIYLFSEMKKQGIPYSELKSILNKIDFSKSNPLWKEENILDDNNVFKKSIGNKIVNVFKTLI